jgi:hypothetical protein
MPGISFDQKNYNVNNLHLDRLTAFMSSLIDMHLDFFIIRMPRHNKKIFKIKRVLKLIKKK